MGVLATSSASVGELVSTAKPCCTGEAFYTWGCKNKLCNFASIGIIMYKIGSSNKSINKTGCKGWKTAEFALWKRVAATQSPEFMVGCIGTGATPLLTKRLLVLGLTVWKSSQPISHRIYDFIISFPKLFAVSSGDSLIVLKFLAVAVAVASLEEFRISEFYGQSRDLVVLGGGKSERSLLFLL